MFDKQMSYVYFEMPATYSEMSRTDNEMCLAEMIIGNI